MAEFPPSSAGLHIQLLSAEVGQVVRFSVYADLSRPLAVEERGTLLGALDEIAPGSGCVGLQGGPNDEVYFTVDADSEADARAAAIRYLDAILRMAKLDLAYTLDLQRSPSAT